MRNVSQQNISDVVIAALSSDIPARNREILESLIRHIHAFCIEAKVTHAELMSACQFLVRAGHISDDARNEFILLSDILGVEVLVDMLDHTVTEGESASTVLRPCYGETPP